MIYGNWCQKEGGIGEQLASAWSQRVGLMPRTDKKVIEMGLIEAASLQHDALMRRSLKLSKCLLQMAPMTASPPTIRTVT